MDLSIWDLSRDDVSLLGNGAHRCGSLYTFFGSRGGKCTVWNLPSFTHVYSQCASLAILAILHHGYLDICKYVTFGFYATLVLCSINLIVTMLFHLNQVLLRYGNKDQLNEWLIPLLEGKIRSGFAMTEPQVASSDATNIECSIRR